MPILAQIPIAPDQHGDLVFHTWKNRIPKGIQVLQAGGGRSASSTAPLADETGVVREKLKNVLFGYDTFLRHCSIKIVNVCQMPGSDHCLVYVKFDVNPAQPGWNTWGEDGSEYKPFLLSLFDKRYKNVKVKGEDGKINIAFSPKRVECPAENVIVFVPYVPEERAVTANQVATPSEESKPA